MSTTRRVFLEILGAGAAVTGMECMGCTGVIVEGTPGGTGTEDVTRGTGGTGGSNPGSGGNLGATGGSGTGGDISGGNPRGGTGGDDGAGTGGTTVNGTGGGSGGAPSGSGGNVGTGGATDRGTGGARQVDAGAADLVPPRPDAGPPVLQPGDVAAGNLTMLAVGGLNAIAGRALAVGRDAAGVYALTLVCTHQGCTAAPAGSVGARQINCPCHGSQFDRNGAVMRGPATRPLVHFGVTVDSAGNIVVHSTMQVAATVRAAV